MCNLTVRYNNVDGLFRYDEAIREAMNRWPGEETDSGQDLETHMREITYAFEDEDDDSAALVDLDEILEDRFGEGEVVYTRQAAESNAAHQVVYLDRLKRPRDCAPVPTFDPHGGSNHRADCGNQGPHAAQDVFSSFAERLGWDFGIQADVLVHWCNEDMIEPLLQHIQKTGQTEDFEEFLTDNFGPTARETDFASLRPR